MKFFHRKGRGFIWKEDSIKRAIARASTVGTSKIHLLIGRDHIHECVNMNIPSRGFADVGEGKRISEFLSLDKLRLLVGGGFYSYPSPFIILRHIELTIHCLVLKVSENCERADEGYQAPIAERTAFEYFGHAQRDLCLFVSIGFACIGAFP